MRKIGKGGYGHVVLASKFTNAVHLYAVKCISLKNCAKDPHLKRYISQETKAMCAIDHPNVVKLENSFAGKHTYIQTAAGTSSSCSTVIWVTYTISSAKIRKGYLVTANRPAF